MVKIIYRRNKSLKKDLMQDKTASFYMFLPPPHLYVVETSWKFYLHLVKKKIEKNYVQ